MIIITLLTVIILQIIYRFVPLNKRLIKDIISFSHATLTLYLYLTDNILGYFDIFHNRLIFIMCMHLAYYISDSIIHIEYKDNVMLLHHILAIYFLSYTYIYNFAGIMQISMFITEIASLILSIRRLFIKTTKKKSRVIDATTFVVYICCRCIIPLILLYDYINNGYQLYTILMIYAILYWLISVWWSSNLFYSILKISY